MANLVFGSYDVLARYALEGVPSSSGNIYGTSSAGGFGQTPINPIFSWIDSGMQSLDPTLNKNSLEIHTLDQRRDPRFLIYMEKKYDYPISYYPFDIAFLSLGLTSVNTSFTIEEFWNPQAGSAANARYYRHQGCMVDTVDLQWRIGRPIDIKMHIMFAHEWFVPGTTTPLYPDTVTIPGATYGVEPTAAPFLYSDTPIKIDPLDTGVQTGSVSGFNVLGAQLKVENKRDRPSAYSIGQNFVTQLPLGRRNVSGSITRMFEDQNQIDQFEDNINNQQGTAFKLRLPLGSTHFIDVVNGKWDPLKPNKDVSRDLLVYTYMFKGFQPTAGGNQVSLV